MTTTDRDESRRHIPPWDEPVSGYDAGSIGQHFLQQHFPDLFKDWDLNRQRIGEVCRAMQRMLEDANEYGAAQIRFRFLCPRRCSVFMHNQGEKLGEYAGSYYECRFCRSTSAEGPDDVHHASGCALIDHAEKRIDTDLSTIVSPPAPKR